MKREMTAKEYLRAMKRISDECLHISTPCKECRFHPVCTCKGTKEAIESAISTIEEWLAENPEETLEPLGDNIYFDPKHRIVPEEITQVFTVEITSILHQGTDFTEAELVERARNVENTISDIAVCAGYLRPDDVKCVRAQQFITKCHEEEV